MFFQNFAERLIRFRRNGIRLFEVHDAKDACGVGNDLFHPHVVACPGAQNHTVRNRACPERFSAERTVDDYLLRAE